MQSGCWCFVMTMEPAAAHAHSYLCAVLDLADAFAHIVQHLTSLDCQRLRHSCTLLRGHPAVVNGVSSVADASLHQEGLRKLKGLCCLRLENPSSIFNLHQLSGLSRLTTVVLVETHVVDLKPLSCIACLRSLELEDVEHHVSLHSLGQIQDLALCRTVATLDVLQLISLTQLGLSEGSQISHLGQLSQLQALRIDTYPPDLYAGNWSAGDWSHADQAALAALVSAGLPALYNLTCTYTLLPPLLSLMLLEELLICWDGQQLPAAMQDVRQLTRLKKLGVFEWAGQPHLRSDSVTTVFLRASAFDQDEGDFKFPSLVGCSQLVHILLSLEEADVTIAMNQLPSRARVLWVEEAEGRLFLELRAAEALHVRRVIDLTWGSDPETLEAEGH